MSLDDMMYSVTLSHEWGIEAELSALVPLTFGDLLRHIRDEMGEDYNCERTLFYDRDYRRVDFGWDGEEIVHNSYFHVVIIDEDMVHRAYRHMPEIRSTWPLTEEEAEELLSNR
jgi:hypothetical protein